MRCAPRARARAIRPESKKTGSNPISGVFGPFRDPKCGVSAHVAWDFFGNFEHLNYLGEIGKTVAARFKVWRYKCRRKSGKSPSSGSLDRGTHLHCFTNSLLSVVKITFSEGPLCGSRLCLIVACQTSDQSRCEAKPRVRTPLWAFFGGVLVRFRSPINNLAAI